MKFIYSKFRKKVASIALLLILVAAGLSSACTSFKREDHIRIRRNGYTDVVVAIRDDVEENVELIERIKEVFADASELLFNATKYVKSIHTFSSYITVTLLTEINSFTITWERKKKTIKLEILKKNVENFSKVNVNQ